MPNRRSTWNQAGLWLLAGLCLAQCGCLLALAGAGVAAGAYAYNKGQLTMVVRGDFANTWHATREALCDLGMPIVDERRRHLGGTIEARTSGRDRIVVALKAISDVHAGSTFLTEVRIRVGVMGHKEISERIAEQLRARLAMRTSPTALPLVESPLAVPALPHDPSGSNRRPTQVRPGATPLPPPP